MSHSRHARRPIPPSAGIGLRSPHFRQVVDEKPPVGWWEVHSENFFAKGGAPWRYLERVRRDYPVSLHGVGLSLGSAELPEPEHLHRLKSLHEQVKPGLISEHLAWNRVGGVHLHDLLPLPYTEESLRLFCRNVEVAQDALKRTLLIENPSLYLSFVQSSIPEPEFLTELVRRTGCGLLLDVNNIYVSCRNLGQDANAYLAAIPPEAVQEIHLAGHHVNQVDGQEIVIDSHAAPVPESVWALYAQALRRFGPVPTLIERDANIPPLADLQAEAAQANRLLLSLPTAVVEKRDASVA